MANVMDVIQQRAREYALQLHNKDISVLRDQLVELKRQVALKEREIKFAEEALTRLSSFAPSLAGVAQCPCCWIFWQIRTDLRAVPGTDRSDEFACSACGSTYTVDTD